MEARSTWLTNGPHSATNGSAKSIVTGIGACDSGGSRAPGAVVMADRGDISLDDFKARLPLVEIVARRVRLTRRGHEHIGLCPFHREKTPSFTVSDAKGFYHCFGCGQHGNAIDFVMATEGLEFAEAVARLAELAGLPLPWRAGVRGPAPDRTLLAAN
jgi:DNA primase